MIFFTSDSHFCCEKVFKRERRPFKSVKNCDKQLIKNWNKVAKKKDTIYVLGDFCSYSKDNPNVYLKGLNQIKKIKADVVLIQGNNERRLINAKFNGSFEEFKNFCLSLGFKDVKQEEFLNIEGEKFYLNHFPKKCKQDFINLFGHVHKLSGLNNPFGINVACDRNLFKLCSLKEILEQLSLQEELEREMLKEE